MRILENILEMRRLRGVLGVLTTVALVLVAGCGGDDKSPAEPEEPEPASIVVQNNSAFTIVDVYYSACSATSYGSDRLAGAIAPGASHSFTDDVSGGCYDILVVSDTGGGAEFKGRQVAAEGPTTVSVTN
jgi:hypothetical protein